MRAAAAAEVSGDEGAVGLGQEGQLQELAAGIPW